MIDSEKDNILIAKFLDLALSDEELILFEERLTKDVEFERKLQTHLTADKVVNNSFSSPEGKLRKQQWKSILNKEEKEENSPQIKKIKTSWKWLSGIVAGLMLVFSIQQLNTMFQKPNMNQLITDSWNKKIGLEFNVTRGETSDLLKQQISTAYDTYNAKNYQTVINLLNNYSSKNYMEDALLLKGLSNYRIGNIDIALQNLDSLANYPTGKKSKVAQWYQGLIYLEQGKIVAAKQFLKLPDNTTQEIRLKE